MSYEGQTIWIIGASSGIGKALAISLASQGACLILSARRKKELTALLTSIGGDQHDAIPVDVSKTASFEKVIDKVFTSYPSIDRVIFMAGIYEPSSIHDMDVGFASKLMQTNLLAPMQLARQVLPYFDKQQSGQLVFCSSVAAYVGLPNGQPYSASKAGLANFVESLYNEAPRYVNIKLISPGFVKTDLTHKNNFYMPFLMEPKDAARIISQKLTSSRFEISFPWRFTYLIKLLRILPASLKLYCAKALTR